MSQYFSFLIHNVSEGRAVVEAEEEEADVMRRVSLRLLCFLRSLLRTTSALTRTGADTLAGLVSSLAKSLGGACSLLAEVLRLLSTKLSSSTNAATFCLYHTARVLAASSRCLAWSGDIAESLTAGLGEALEDSFHGLDLLPRASRQALACLLDGEMPRPKEKQAAVELPDILILRLQQQVQRLQPSAHQLILRLFCLHGCNKSETWSHSQTNSSKDANASDWSDLKTAVQEEKEEGEIVSISLQSHPPREQEEEVQDPISSSSSPSGRVLEEEAVDDHHDFWWATQWEQWERSSTFFVLLIFPLLLLGSVAHQVAKRFYFSLDLSRSGLLGPRVRWLGLFFLFLAMGVLYHRHLLLIQQEAIVTAIHGHLYHQVEQSRRNASTANGHREERPATATMKKGQEEEVDMDMETARWVNVLFSALWTVEHPANSQSQGEGVGGLGSYLSGIYGEMVSTQLAALPPGLTNLRLKDFSLGSQPPLFKGLKIDWLRNESCYLASLKSKEQQPENADLSGASSLRRTTFQDLYKLLMMRLLSQPSPARTNQGVEQKIFSSCDRLRLEAEVVFSSRDLVVQLSLRPADLKSALPAATAVVTSLHLQGQFFLEMALSPDYPFLSKGLWAFCAPPRLTFTLTTLGGLAISRIPVVKEALVGAARWLLDQYTVPQQMELDLRHLLCPSCDQLPVRPSLPDLLHRLSLQVGGLLKERSRRVLDWMRVTASVVKYWAKEKVRKYFRLRRGEK